MVRILITFISILLALPISAIAASSNAASIKSAEEIESYIDPIALYPDIILSSLLPAATFPDQITDAYLLIRDKSDADLIAQQTWDDSVKIIATYPGILKMMYEKLDWTTNLGEAFLNQSELVMSLIQQRRSQAQSVGNLKTDEQQIVTTQYLESGSKVIVIEPKEPDVVYIQAYTSPTIYTRYQKEPTEVAPLVTFGLGLALGAAIANNQNDHYYYYSRGPWGGNIWINNSYHNDWYDAQRDRQEFYQDRYQKEQDFRHDRISEQQDFRNDFRNDRQEFRQEQIKSNPDYHSQRQEKLNQARISMSSSGLKANSDRSFNKSNYSGQNLASSYNKTTSSSFQTRKTSYTQKVSNRGLQSRSAITSSNLAGRSVNRANGFRRR